jgi:hypothetical protein
MRLKREVVREIDLDQSKSLPIISPAAAHACLYECLYARMARYQGLVLIAPNTKFFHFFFVTSIFGHMHEALNIGKKIINYTV